MNQRLTLKKSFLRDGVMYLPGQLVPEDVTEAQMAVLIANDSIQRQMVEIEEFRSSTPDPSPAPAPQPNAASAPQGSKFDLDPAHLVGMEDGELQVMLSNLGCDPAHMSSEDMRAQLSSGFKGQTQSSPETTGTKLDEAIKDSTPQE